MLPDTVFLQSLGELLIKCVADTLTARLGAATALGQVAQMLVNVEYLRDGCAEVDRYLTNLRYAGLPSPKLVALSRLET